MILDEVEVEVGDVSDERDVVVVVGCKYGVQVGVLMSWDVTNILNKINVVF